MYNSEEHFSEIIATKYGFIWLSSFPEEDSIVE